MLGKCKTCALLSDLRQCCSSHQHRGIVSHLHAMHRVTYMQERKIYYSKMAKALADPENYMSIIGNIL